jgi:phage-related protein
MSDVICSRGTGGAGKPLVWLHGEVKTPPLSADARVQAGVLLRSLQQGASVGMPNSRPMPIIGRRCHELRVNDRHSTWRLIYRMDPDAIIIVEVFEKKTEKTPVGVIDVCRRRLAAYDDAARS